MPTDSWQWCTHTEPFSALGHPDQPAHFVVEQIGDKDFRIPDDVGFQYNPPREPAITVTCRSLPSTDFASIPRYMSWFVSRYGRHTAAALVHDQLVTPGMSFADRTRADRRFLTMLDSLEVPPVQSRVMWAAVTLATHTGGPWVSRAGVAVWALTAAAGMALLGWGLASLTVWMIVVALLAPVVAALCWGTQYPAGLVAGYALPLVAVPALASLAGYWVYWLVEKAVKIGRARLSHNRHKPLPEPMGYQGR